MDRSKKSFGDNSKMLSFFRIYFKGAHNPPRDINLLLLGETGAGKSTLINSISNYFNYPNFKEAQKEKIDILIPVLLNTMESSNVSSQNEHKLYIENKRTTQYGKVYLFPIKVDDKTFNLRLIDMPGIEDRRGMEQNNLILDNILAYLKRQGKLYAICLVLKANQTRITNSVEYYLKYILTRLDERPSQNIIFITTYSKAAGYTAGETKHHCLIPLVKNIQSKPPHVSIPLSDNNIFAVDNEAFNALLEMRDGNYYHQQAMEGFEQSWNVSSKEIQRLLRYIVGGCRNALLRTHVVESINSQTESRPFSLPEESPTMVDEINLLLLGETGVGKSTLINSISNYFIYPNFEEAQKGKIDILIPIRLRLTKDYKVYGKPDNNENLDSSKSATQRVKVHPFPIQIGQKIFNLRLIDTPSVGDTRGIVQDNINMDNIFAYVATLKKLHGICFVLKSGHTSFNKLQEYSLKQMLTRLDKSASQNIIFITTYSKSCRYKAKEIRENVLVPLVRNIQSKSPHVSFPLNDDNIFTLDNEIIEPLLTMQEGTYYNRRELKSFAYSWEISSKEFQRLLTYVVGDFKDAALKPYEVESTIKINEVRFLVGQLAASITELSKLIQTNIRLLDGYKIHLDFNDQQVKNGFKSRDDIHIKIEELMKDLNKWRSELEGEVETISKIIVKFSYFLQEHALLPFNDAYNDHIEQSINNEKCLGEFADQDVIAKLEKLLIQHQFLQKTAQENVGKLQKEDTSNNLTAQEIKNNITELYSLKHMGKSIRELTEKSRICRDKAQKGVINLDSNTDTVEEQYKKTLDSGYHLHRTRSNADKDHQSVSRNSRFGTFQRGRMIQSRGWKSLNTGSEWAKWARTGKTKHPRYYYDSKNSLLTDSDSDLVKPAVSTDKIGRNMDKGRRGDSKEHQSTSRNRTSQNQDDQQKITPAADMQKKFDSISDNVNNQENSIQNVHETMKKQQESVKQFMEKIGLLLESNEIGNIDTLKKQLKSLFDSEDGRKEHQKPEHSESNESETIYKDVEGATQKESPEIEPVYEVTYTYRTNDSEDDKSLKPRTDDASNSTQNTGLRPEKPSPERTYNDPREPRHSDARYNSEEDNRLAEASRSRNHPTRSNFFPRSTSPGRYHSTTERKSHRRDHRTHYSPRRYRRRSESYDSSDRDFRRSSRRHATRYTDESESYDSDDNPSRNRTRSKSYKDYDSSHDRHKKSRHVKNKSSRRRRSSDEDIDTKREKKSHRRPHKEKCSSRRHRRSSESYDSDDHESRRSSSSGRTSSARSFDSRSRSKDKTGRSRGSEQHRSTRSEKKSRHEVKESSRRQRHRLRSDSYDSADDRDSRKRSQRCDCKHSRREDKSDSDSDGGHSTGNSLKQSKNHRESNKIHDSGPVKSSKSAHSPPKNKHKTGDINDKRSGRSSKNGKTDPESTTPGKSSSVDSNSTESSTKKPNINEGESENQTNAKNENCDSRGKQSVTSSSKDTVQESKSKNKIESKSGLSQKSEVDANSSDKSETHTVQDKNSKDNLGS